MPIVYLSTAYLAPVQYYCKLLAYRDARLESHEHFLKQTYRNRCVIASANGPLTLTVPVEKGDALKCLTKDIRISEHGRWRHLHWNALVSAYHMSPFFEYYEDDFAPFYTRRYDFLMDFNEALQELICRLLDLDVRATRLRTHRRARFPRGHPPEASRARPRLPPPALLPGFSGKIRLPAQLERGRSPLQHGSRRPARPETLHRESLGKG